MIHVRSGQAASEIVFAMSMNRQDSGNQMSRV